jgi:hypothetical protein
LAQESDVGFDAAYARFIQRAAHSSCGLVAIGAAYDDLGKQGVEGRGDYGTRPHGRAVYAHARSRGQCSSVMRPCEGEAGGWHWP